MPSVVAFYYQLHSLLYHYHFHVHYCHMYMSCWKAWATSQLIHTAHLHGILFWSLTCLHTFHFQSLFLLFKIENFFSSSTIPLNCNFIFPQVILRGTTTILQCIPVTCLHGPRLLMSCNVHVSWKYTRGNTRLVEVNTWKCTSRGSTRVEVYAWKVYVWNKRCEYSHVETYLPSLSHYITSIFCWLTNTRSRMISSVAHI